MRKLTRLGIDAKLRAYLAKKVPAALAAGADLERIWKNARKTKTMGRGRDVLRRMVGDRERCMFCEDSRCTDIDHYWPKQDYPDKCFAWENFLYVCGGCNRQKGERFPLDKAGKPLLLNPVDDEPWLSLDFDEATGIITARFDAGTNDWDPRGHATVDPKLLPLNIQAIVEGRKKTYRQLVRSINSFLRSAFDPLQYNGLEAELIAAISDNLDYGLAEWFFLYDGADLEPFASLRRDYAPLWGDITRLIRP